MHNFTCSNVEGWDISSLKTLGKMACMIVTKKKKENPASKSMFSNSIQLNMFILEIINTSEMFLIQRLI